MILKLTENWKIILRAGISIALLWCLSTSFDWLQIGKLILETDLAWGRMNTAIIIMSKYLFPDIPKLA